ncbi:hypothetical protein POM88_048855 [Heracleum sosnowskyi]|uniref:FBD domain-containing protein n=1 Tax=Heracleum sosnowskyi TaxID=360622 RepID=A0AAD8GW18_9APIA|nr:hypothetical protein POM88_048855 [Heracleum sosnowskyi]
MEAKRSNVVKVFGSLHRIKKLSIAMHFMKYLPEVSCLLCMIRSAPSLYKLYISTCAGCAEVDLKNYRIEDSEDCTGMNHLEIVMFGKLKGLTAELELVKFVLAHSPLLKTMFIHHNESIKKGAALTMTEEMLQYPRASTRAQIRHLKCCDEIEDEFWDNYKPPVV